jgi:hypothetical protein
MAENSKYSSQKLTERDTDVLDKVNLNFLIKFHILIDRFPNPKKYAFKEGYKSVTSEKDLLKLISINFIQENPVGKPFEPKDLTKYLSNELNDLYETANEHLLNQATGFSKIINPTSINEKLLQKFVDDGSLINYLGKEKYEEYFLPVPGRPPASKSDEKSRGKKSIYIVTEDIEQLKMTLQNPESKEYLYEKLIKTDTISKIIKYIISAAFYILKIQDSKVIQLLKQTSLLIDYKLTQKDVDNMIYLIRFLKIIDDRRIDSISNQATEDILKSKDFFYTFVPLFGFIKL